MLVKIKHIICRKFCRTLAMLIIICVVIKLWNTVVDTMCPVVYKFSTGCRIELGAILHHNVNVTECSLTVNDRTVLQWQNPTGTSYLFHIDDTCRLEKIFSNSDPETVLRYISNIPKRTMVGGILHNSEQLQTLYSDIALTSWFEEHQATVGNTVFLMWAGYKGLLKGAVLTESLSDVVLSDTVYFGSTFDYNPEPVEYSEVLNHHPDVDEGGHWSPTGCQPRWSIAIIIPYRNRQTHLWMFFENITRFLKLQQIEFTIFVVEQAKPELFNRAALMNVGYLEARKLGDFDCYVFHDVDLVPEDLANLYKCDDQPRHLVIARSAKDYSVKENKWIGRFGGVTILKPEHIEAINGFPNSIFGWGGEDDEIYGRVRKKYEVLRYPTDIGTYHSFEHGEDEGNPHMARSVSALYKSAKHNAEKDGLNTAMYDLLFVDRQRLYTNITVRIPGPKTMEEAKKLDVQLGIIETDGKLQEPKHSHHRHQDYEWDWCKRSTQSP